MLETKTPTKPTEMFNLLVFRMDVVLSKFDLASSNLIYITSRIVSIE